MKFITKAALLFIMAFSVNLVSAQDKKPASPPAEATGTIAGSNITIKYNSPFVKGRTIWGELVPYGQIWRAGANDATTFETSKAIKIEGKDLAAGTYSFFVIPEKDGTATLIFNTEAKQWGAYKYDAAKDALRVTVKTKKSKTLAESLVYKIGKKDVILAWEYLEIPFSVK